MKGMKEKRAHVGGVRSARGILRLLIGIALLAVLALVGLKLLFNIDFGFFRTTYSLKPTALTLEDVRAVQELTTAEYFGEVIGTARDYLVRRAVPDTENLLLRLMSEANPGQAALTPTEETMLDAVRAVILKRGGMIPRLVERVYDRAGLLELVKPEFLENKLNPAFAEAMVETLLAKRDIAYLARGTVRAGYDLSLIDESKFFLCPATGTVYVNAEPDVLGKDINPWFIYDPAAQTMVKGFEIIAQAGINLEDDDALDFIKAVKEECRQRLVDDAVKEGLRDRARTSAEETLSNLFRLFDSRVRAVRLVGEEEFAKQKTGCTETE